MTVTDASNNPVSGVNVTFTAPSSGASGIFSNSTATITVATNASGVATAPFTANSTAGGYNVTAAANGLTTLEIRLDQHRRRGGFHDGEHRDNAAIGYRQDRLCECFGRDCDGLLRTTRSRA